MKIKKEIMTNGLIAQVFDEDLTLDKYWNPKMKKRTTPLEFIWENKLDESCDIAIFPIKNTSKKYKAKRKCKLCDREFVINSTNQVFCQFCFKIRKCSNENCIGTKIFLANAFIYTYHMNQVKEGLTDDIIICSEICSKSYSGKQSCKNNYEEWCEECKDYTSHTPNGSCKRCVGRQNALSDAANEWRASNKCHEILAENGRKWNESEKGKKFHSNLLKMLSKTDAGIENRNKNLEKIHKDMANGKGANSKENIRKRIEDKNGNFGKGIQIKFCKNCNENTQHIGSRCLVCNPSERISRFILKFCNYCNKETPHKYNVETGEFYCQVCAGEKVWCKKHEQFENPKYNSNPGHGIFYKLITKNWINNYIDEFNYIKSIVDDINDLENSKPICGIYLWRIDNIPYYCGKSYDILSRSYDHMYEIQNNSKYWLNINDININNNHTISVEVLQECDKNILNTKLHQIELEWIAKIKPISQKCNGTDHIIPLNQRDYTINNLKEKYEEKLINFKEERRENKI